MGEEDKKTSPDRDQHSDISDILNPLELFSFKRNSYSFGGRVEHDKLIFAPTIYSLFGE